ncbi:hypothetical protein TeGR_g7005 [Tetraparma gracilis]|uniref:ATP synthase F0 subunit 8 n=1 Tax=Tetraparma gracilis TaxID=2962635 RepID=A0ABQ6MX60_9STRA|nr:hypothetical protein TeGR_g7005 [Tetraparma gracilis]
MLLEFQMPAMWLLGSVPAWEAFIWFCLMWLAWEWGVREIVMASPKMWLLLLIARAGIGWLNSFVPELPPEPTKKAEEDTKKSKK